MNGRAWTAAEDAALLAAEVVPVADRTRCEGESDLQRLARELGRSEAAIASRRYKLMQRPEVREATERERKAAERVRRDRAIVAAVKAGATFHEAGRRASVSKQMVRRIIDREAPDLHLRAHERGYARRVLRQRIARDVAPRVLDAALAGEGINLTPAAVAELVTGIKASLRRERESLSESA